MNRLVEGLGGLLIINGVGLFLVGLVSMPEYKRAKGAGYTPGFLAERAPALVQLGWILTAIGVPFLLVGIL